MKLNSRIFIATLGAALLASVAWAVPQTHTPNQQPAQARASQQSQTVSGKIAAFSKTSLTLNVGSEISDPGEPASSQKAPTTMTFEINKNTTVDGSLKVGEHADVTYRVESGQNVAVSVRVTS
ncbi:MAG TPA: hypothetical protein VMV61_11600 [Patescibacteria group bacterium]|nr:hypothetical protein [Patescibacteria group bacterium]